MVKIDINDALEILKEESLGKYSQKTMTSIELAALRLLVRRFVEIRKEIISLAQESVKRDLLLAKLEQEVLEAKKVSDETTSSKAACEVRAGSLRRQFTKLIDIIHPLKDREISCITDQMITDIIYNECGGNFDMGDLLQIDIEVALLKKDKA